MSISKSKSCSDDVHVTRKPNRVRHQLYFNKPSRVDPSHQAECDTDHILRKYSQTGLLTHVNRHQGDYGDYLEVPMDYQASLNHVLAAQAAFDSLPSNLRLKFGNDPAQFLTFVGDPSNYDEMVSLGLAKAKPPVSVDANLVDEVDSSA